MALSLDKFRDVDLVIDKANDNFIQRQFVSQADYKGRTLTVQVTNNGEIGEIPGLFLNLRWQNQASGLTDLTGFVLIDKENSVFRIEYPEHMMTPGKVVASIQLIHDGKTLHMKQFELTVQKLAGEAVGIVEKAEYSALVAVLSDANKFRTDIDTLEVVKAGKVEVDEIASTKVDKNGVAQVSWEMLNQDAREQIAGDKVAVVGKNAVSTENVVDKSQTTLKTTELNKTGIYSSLNGSLLDVNFSNNRMKIPAGGFRVSNYVREVKESVVDLTPSLEGAGQYVNLFFDTILNTFSLIHGGNLGNVAQSQILCGTIDRINKRAYTQFPITIENVKPANRFYNGAEAIFAPFEPVTVDFTNKKIIIPKITNMAIGQRVFGQNDMTGAQEKVINMVSGEQLFVFDIDVKEYRCVPFATINNTIKANEIPLAYLSMDHALFFADFTFNTIGGNSVDRDWGAMALLVGLNKSIDFKLTSRRIVIPATTNMWVRNRYFPSTIVTEGVEISVDIPDNGSEGCLVFNTNNFKFKIYMGGPSGFASNEVIVAAFSINYKKVVIMTSDYLIDGVSPYPNPDPAPDPTSSDFLELADWQNQELIRLQGELVDVVSNGYLSIAAITDTHGWYSAFKAVTTLGTMGLVDRVCHLGDLVNTEQDDMYDFLRLTTKIFSYTNIPYDVIRGNHDSNLREVSMTDDEYSKRITNADRVHIKQRTFNPTEKDKGYYYVDYPDEKIRLLFTNSSQENTGVDTTRNGWSASQLKWIAESCLKTVPTGYHVAVFGHHHVIETESLGEMPRYAEVLLAILKAYRDGTTYENTDLNIDASYSGTRKVIGYFHGHTHCDSHLQDPTTGIFVTGTASSVPDYYASPAPDSTSWERERNTRTQDCWDVITFKTDENKVILKRFGAGENREYIY